jgi:hypothetical protein
MPSSLSTHARRARASAGGRASAARLTPEERAERARAAGRASGSSRRQRILAQITDPAVQEWLDAQPPIADAQRAVIATLLGTSTVDGAR